MTMPHRVLILGIDGYIGWALANHLLNRPGYEVCGLDNGSRRRLVKEIGSDSLTPIQPFSTRERYLRSHKNFIDLVCCVDLSHDWKVSRLLKELQPDTIVHLAEQPSAPYSMRDTKACMQTQVNNVAGTLSLLWAMREHCPEAHLLKLGTMGEYGTPNCDIPEGEIPVRPCGWVPEDEEFSDDKNIIHLYKSCPMKGLPFPRSPGSFYHLSKVHDTHNIIFACKTWGLRSTDIMQGVVFGVTINDDTSPSQLTRFDYDEYFGTVINRFCVQSIINHHLTIYGEGNQTRGYLPLKDSIQCLTLAIENPPSQGEYRVFNQFENIYSINQLADLVISASEQFNLYPHKMHLPNPRTEADKHYYNPAHQRLFDLGYIPTTDIKSEIIKLINDLISHKDRVIKEHIMPTTTWR